MATMGLGGDSHLRMDVGGVLRIGPRRAVPLALAEAEYPGAVLPALRSIAADRRACRSRHATDFLLPGTTRSGSQWTDRERAVLAEVARGPVGLIDLADRLDTLDPSLLPLDRLEAIGAVRRAGVTPTDVLHAVGRLGLHDPSASRLGALMLADRLGVSVAELCSRLEERIAELIAVFVLRHSLAKALPAGLSEGQVEGLLVRAVAPEGARAPARLTATLESPLIAIGAPVAEYFPAAARLMRAQLVIPEFAAVANAIGAAVGRLQRVVETEVRPVYDGTALSHYAVHSAEELSEWPSLEEALARADQLGRAIALRELHGALAGRDGVQVESRYIHRNAKAKETEVEVFLGVLVRTTAWLPDAFSTSRG
jgi:N-methylhydantoinase A/oxoprolinase/acetone carboxylase beta subunit